MHRNAMKLQSFDCEADPVPPNTPAGSRPSQRVRSFDLAAPYHIPSLQFFDCDVVDLPHGTQAVPRPAGRERRLPILAEKLLPADDRRGRIRVPADGTAVVLLAAAEPGGHLYRIVNLGCAPLVVLYRKGYAGDKEEEVAVWPGNSVDIQAAQIACRVTSAQPTDSLVEYYWLGGGRRILIR